MTFEIVFVLLSLLGMMAALIADKIRLDYKHNTAF